MEALRETGIIVYIDRPMELLLCEVDADRPLLAGGRQRLISLFLKGACFIKNMPISQYKTLLTLRNV